MPAVIDALLDFSSLPDAFEIVADSAKKYLTKLVPLSQKLLGIAVLFSGSWLLLKESLTNSPRNAIAALMQLLMQAAIALAVILQWPLFADIVHGLQTELSMALGGGSSAITTAITPISRAMQDILGYFFVSPIPKPPASMAWWNVVIFYVAEFMMQLVVVPATMVLSLFAVLLLGLTIALLAGAIMFAEVSIAIGLVAAPFMIALNFFPLMNFTLDGLIKFLLGAIILKFVAMLMALILGEAIASLFAGGAIPMNGNTMEMLVAMAMTLVTAGMFLYSAMKVDDVARALMSGGVVGGPGAKVVSAGMVTGASTAAGGALGGAVGAGRGAISGGRAGGIKGAMSGAMSGGMAGVKNGMKKGG